MPTVPALTTVASTLWAPESSSEVVEWASRSANALPWAAGWSESAKMCRDGLPASAGWVVGRVSATASLAGSSGISLTAMDTGCWSLAPSAV